MSAMKFYWAIVVYLIIGAVLAWGMLLTFRGNFWVLPVVLIAYIVAFAKIGCLPKSH